MKKWEYMLVDFDGRRVKYINGDEDPNRSIYITDFLDKAGKKGWEAVNVVSSSALNSVGVILFKRALTEE